MEQPAKSLTRGAPSPKGWRGTGTILLVDDEEFVLDVGLMMLEGMGFSVRTARDGMQAVEI